jgi:antitoxin HigA-1
LEEAAMRRNNTGQIPFPHPGKTIREDFLVPLGMSVDRLALELRVPVARMSEIVNGRRGVTADTALRLARYFNTTPKFWLNLQAAYDIAVTAETKADEIERTVRPRADA